MTYVLTIDIETANLGDIPPLLEEITRLVNEGYTNGAYEGVSFNLSEFDNDEVDDEP